MKTTIREIVSEDTALAGQFIYEAFAGISTQHGFPPDFPSIEAATGFAEMWVQHPLVYGVAAEANGRFIASNFLTEFDPIRAVGPITVDPGLQASGVGRKLMQTVIERGKDAPGIRLVQAAFNTRSMSLYTSLGFDVKEPLAHMSGKPKGDIPKGLTVRPMKFEDLKECAELCKRVHGFDRTGELSLTLTAFKPFVAIREGRVVAYASTVSFWPLNHGVAETENDMCGLLIQASRLLDESVALLLPTRQANFHRWALRSGLRMVQPLTLMSMGEYNKPAGSYFPSVLY